MSRNTDIPGGLIHETNTHVHLLRRDVLLTQAMGGPLAEQSEEHLERIYDVLDLGCGCGGWAAQMAHRYPEMTVVGVDCNETFIHCARSFASIQELENASFQVMDVTQPLPLLDASFDLVNIRLLGNTLLPEQWEPLMQECQRLLRPGGVLRITEAEWGCLGMVSAAFARLFSLTLEALAHAQPPLLSLLDRPTSLTPLLQPFLRRHGFEAVQGVAAAIDHSAGTEGHLAFASEYLLWFQNHAATMIEAHLLSREMFDVLFKQTSQEILNTFSGILYLFTAWGEKPMSAQNNVLSKVTASQEPLPVVVLDAGVAPFLEHLKQASTICV
ncbi:class I SAM-dependent methyltransferase [Ktedonobacter robiniae]|nr:class I SAM-dependent methyltransferase [Ktedonobacter robiniae]